MFYRCQRLCELRGGSNVVTPMPLSATTRDGNGSSVGLVVGAAAGGAIVGIGIAIAVVILLLRRSPTKNVKPLQGDTQDALSVGLPVQAHIEHFTDLNEDLEINKQGGPFNGFAQNDPVFYASSIRASRPSAASSASRPMNSNDLHFKDQSRSVQATPMVHVLPPSIVDAHLPGRLDDSIKEIEAFATAVATPVDMSHLCESPEELLVDGSTKRPPIDP